ncbi:hypothetical protein FRC03_009190 [Tulasnella sp. 419]|nr:hypothetical protein FRC03_009190 [Tulasnella sp. 419]
MDNSKIPPIEPTSPPSLGFLKGVPKNRNRKKPGIGASSSKKVKKPEAESSNQVASWLSGLRDEASPSPPIPSVAPSPWVEGPSPSPAQPFSVVNPFPPSSVHILEPPETTPPDSETVRLSVAVNPTFVPLPPNTAADVDTGPLRLVQFEQPSPPDTKESPYVIAVGTDSFDDQKSYQAISPPGSTGDHVPALPGEPGPNPDTGTEIHYPVVTQEEPAAEERAAIERAKLESEEKREQAERRAWEEELERKRRLEIERSNEEKRKREHAERRGLEEEVERENILRELERLEREQRERERLERKRQEKLEWDAESRRQEEMRRRLEEERVALEMFEKEKEKRLRAESQAFITPSQQQPAVKNQRTAVPPRDKWQDDTGSPPSTSVPGIPPFGFRSSSSMAKDSRSPYGFTSSVATPFAPVASTPFVNTSAGGPTPFQVQLAESLSAPSGLEEYAKKRRDLLEILSSLHATGVQKELDLPQIVVVGSQSVGKSSLIESMSGISLPRDAGTCTRCPMECRLQHAEKWSCKISLRFHVDSEGRSLDDVHEKTFGPTIYDKNEVAKVLRRAQRAILRPMLDHNLFLDDSDLGTPGFPPQSFSANTVCIKVAGPDVPDLYFYDLPGIIANVSDGGNERDIKLVEELAKTYMSRENCIILLVISCETDFENQGAGRLVLRNADLRSRAVGVLTKVDRIEPGTSSKWVNILKNRDNSLKNGWFCVKQPNARELEAGISWEDARDNEDAFFRLNDPWASLESKYRRRMGSKGLADYLSTLLSDLVSQKLPIIQREISRLLIHVEQELRDIPAPNIKDPRREVITIIRDFRRIVSKHIQGLAPDSPDSDPSLPGLIHSINGVYDSFRCDIHRTAPQFMPWERTYFLPTSRFYRPELDQMVRDATSDDIEGTIGQNYHIDEVMEMAKRSRTRELPGNYPFTVTENIIRSVIQSWGTYASKCFESVKEALFEQISQLIGIHFGKYSHSGFSDKVLSVFMETIEEHAISARAKIESLCELESTPFTQNDQYFLDYREKLLKRYRDLYRQSRGQQSLFDNLKRYNAELGHPPFPAPYDNFWVNVNTILNCLDRIGISGCKAEDLTLLLPKDSMDPALEIMAEARAYFQVAFKRFTDTVPQQIDAEFLRGFDSSLDIALMYMDLSTETCLEFLQESPETVRRREELYARKRRLERAREKLKSSGRF